jgi:hypothetical protein
VIAPRLSTSQGTVLAEPETKNDQAREELVAALAVSRSTPAEEG